MAKKSFWIIYAVDDFGYWILNRFHYVNDLNGALKEAARFKSGELDMANPSADITVVEGE